MSCLLYDIDYLTADEFSAELASGNAFVAGQDEEGRPVVVIIIYIYIVFAHCNSQNGML